jgi:hypothetical protein
MAKYSVYPGKFKCQECGKDVMSLRSYSESKELTWMCSEKHLSKINLSLKKKKKDYLGE